MCEALEKAFTVQMNGMPTEVITSLHDYLCQFVCVFVSVDQSYALYVGSGFSCAVTDSTAHQMIDWKVVIF